MFNKKSVLLEEIEKVIAGLQIEELTTAIYVCDKAVENNWTFLEAWDTTDYFINDFTINKVRLALKAIPVKDIKNMLLFHAKRVREATGVEEFMDRIALLHGLKNFVSALDFVSCTNVLKVCIYAIEHHIGFMPAYGMLEDLFVVEVQNETHTRFLLELSTTGAILDLIQFTQEQMQITRSIWNLINGFTVTEICTFLHVASDAIRQDISFCQAYQDLGTIIPGLEDENGEIISHLLPLFNQSSMLDLISYIHHAANVMHTSTTSIYGNFDPHLRVHNIK